MWTDSISFPEIINAKRWKVEYFAGVDTSKRKTSKLPFIKLGDLFLETKATLNPQEDPEKIFVYVGMENVESNTGDFVGDLSKKGVEIKSRSKIFSAGQILYGRLRPTLNKVCLCPSYIDSGICSGEFYVLSVCGALVKPRVLREILASEFVLEQVTRFIAGAALPRISISDLATIEVPLPSIEIQENIEKRLFEFDERRKNLKQELAEIPSLIARMLQKSQRLN